jgi:galactoside O-acetyltransferase
MRFFLKKIYTIKNRFMIKLRRWFYKKIFGAFGPRSSVIGRISVYHPENIYFGDNSTINDLVVLNAREKIVIGNYVHISPGCIINAGGLNYSQKLTNRTHLHQPVTIGDGVWLGSGSIINPGVVIGENSVIGAGSVVTKDIPANVVAFGVPARVFKNID